MNYKVFFIIIIGLIIRITFAFLPGFKIDVNDWFAWALRLSNFDYANFYSPQYFSDYTPGYLYILSFLGFIKNLFSIPDSIFYILLKTPAIISELLIALLVYSFLKNFVTVKKAALSSLFIIFNPALILNSSVWGQIDSILTLLMLASVVSLSKNKLIFSSIFFALAILVKPQAVALLPLFVLYFIKEFKFQNIFMLIIPGLMITFIFTYPFFPQESLFGFIKHVSKSAALYPYTSVNAYNLWGTIGFWINDSYLWNKLSYQTWSYIILAIYWVLIAYFYLKKNISLYSMTALATLGFFFLPTRVHERYLYPALVFLILTAAIYKSRLLFYSAALLSILHFLNLYYVYVYYNEIYFKMPKVFYNPAVYNFLELNGKTMSLISTAVFILLSIAIIADSDSPLIPA